MKAIPLITILMLGCAPVTKLNSQWGKKNGSAVEAVQDTDSTDASKSGGGGKPASPNASSSGTENQDDSKAEEVLAPGNISGALLVCSIITPASEANPTTSVGCRFGTTDGARAPLNSVAQKANFDGVPPPGITMNIVRSPNAEWEAIYHFTGANAVASNAGADAAQVLVNLENTLLGERKSSLKVGLRAVHHPQLLAWAPICRGSACSVRQESSKLVWSASQGQVHDWVAAVTKCHNLKYAGKSNWRLPSIDQMRKAQAEKISELESDSRLNLQKSSRFWSDSRSGSADAYTIDWWSQSPTAAVKPMPVTSSEQHVLCVRD